MLTPTKNNSENKSLTCEICGKNNFETVFCGEDKLLGIEGSFCFNECLNCGIYLLSPKISSSEMENYYPEEYICYLEAIEDDKNPFRRFDSELALSKRCHQITKRVGKPGKILDIGCATGIFLNGMKQLGWSVVGIEPNTIAANYAKKRFGIDVIIGYIDDAHLPDESFDVITLWDVLEHVPDPNFFIKTIYKLLKPGGFVIATLPNANAWERYLFNEYWVGWDIPRHYRVHTPDTITRFLKENSFIEIEIFSFIGRHGAFMLSVEFLLKSWQTKKWIKEIIRKILGSLAVRIILYPLFIIAEIFNRSNNMSFSAKRPLNPSNRN
jgi:SAM-dependent methyltransferase